MAKRGGGGMSVGSVFSGMFAVIFFYYLLSSGFGAIMPTATTITIWGLDLTFIVTLAVLGVVLYSGYRIITKGGWN